MVKVINNYFVVNYNIALIDSNVTHTTVVNIIVVIIKVTIGPITNFNIISKANTQSHCWWQTHSHYFEFVIVKAKRIKVKYVEPKKNDYSIIISNLFKWEFSRLLITYNPTIEHFKFVLIVIYT